MQSVKAVGALKMFGDLGLVRARWSGQSDQHGGLSFSGIRDQGSIRLLLMVFWSAVALAAVLAVAADVARADDVPPVAVALPPYPVPPVATAVPPYALPPLP
jgi:hypothetical protein